MGTNMLYLLDSEDPSIELEVYIGNGGLCLFPHAKTNELGIKFWIRDMDINKLINVLEWYRDRPIGGNKHE